MLGHQGQNGSGVRPISQGTIQIEDGGRWPLATLFY
jgi:hypothetical protein